MVVVFFYSIYLVTLFTLPETNSSHLKMDDWKMKLSFGAYPIFRGCVGFRDGHQPNGRGAYTHYKDFLLTVG